MNGQRHDTGGCKMEGRSIVPIFFLLGFIHPGVVEYGVFWRRIPPLWERGHKARAALESVFHLYRDDGAGKRDESWWLMMSLYHSCMCISI